MTLLRAAAAADPDVIAFADQDDVWLPDKLARGVGALQGVAGPGLYCSRQILVDQVLRRIGESAPSPASARISRRVDAEHRDWLHRAGEPCRNPFDRRQRAAADQHA